MQHNIDDKLQIDSFLYIVEGVTTNQLMVRPEGINLMFLIDRPGKSIQVEDSVWERGVTAWRGTTPIGIVSDVMRTRAAPKVKIDGKWMCTRNLFTGIS